MQLSEHFTLEEFLRSDRAKVRGIDNTPTPEIVENLKGLAERMERVRVILGHPITILSGYRCSELNAAVGGSKKSAHMDGYACDFVCPMFGSAELVARRLDSAGLVFDQLIFEQSWVHVSVDPRMRRVVMTAHFADGKASYTPGIA